MNPIPPVSMIPFSVRTHRLTWGTFLIGLFVSLGLLLGWLLLVTWILQLIPGERRADGVLYERLSYTIQGEPVISQTLEPSTGRILDLQRHILEIPAEEANRQATYLGVQPLFRKGPVPGFKVSTLGEARDHSAYWYSVENCDRTRFGYFVAIHPRSKKEMGYIGTRGWQVHRPSVQDQFDLRNGGLFAGNYGGGLYQYAYEASRNSIENVTLVSQGKAYRVDLEQRKIIPISPTPGVFFAADVYTTIKRTSGTQSWVESRATSKIALRTANKIILVNLADAEEQSWLLTDPQVGDANTFLFLDNGELLASRAITEYDERTGFLRSSSYKLFWLNSAGDILRSESVEFPASSSREWMISQAVISLSGAPVVIGLVNCLLIPMPLVQFRKYHYLAACRQLLPVTWPTLLLAVFLAGLAIYLARRHAQSRGMTLHPAWFITLAIFGLPGYFGYRWHRHWPPPGIPPVPELNGTEILVPAVS